LPFCAEPIGKMAPGTVSRDFVSPGDQQQQGPPWPNGHHLSQATDFRRQHWPPGSQENSPFTERVSGLLREHLIRQNLLLHLDALSTPLGVAFLSYRLCVSAK